MNTNQPNQSQTPTAPKQQLTNPSPPTQAPPQPTSKKKTLWLLISIIVLLLSATGILGYKYYEVTQQLENQQPIPLSSPQPTPKGLPPQTSPQTKIGDTSEWREAKFGGIFSYEYPNSWHVATLWQDTSRQGIILAMDPDPISTAPRGGPLATFEIRVINGMPNPDEIFEEEKSKVNEDNYYDITSETLTSDLGTIYHYKGKIAGEMLKGEPIEQYFLTFKKSENDPHNQQIVVASLMLQDASELSAMLRHIVMSFKQL